MVSRNEKLRAMNFICRILQNSGLYVIQRTSPEHIVVVEKTEINPQPRTISVPIPNFLGKIDNFHELFEQNQRQGRYTAPVFYKDGKTAFVRMVERNMSWRTEKSLKNYSPQTINQMLHLRGIEKAVIDDFLSNKLTYYQPVSERLEESIRTFEMKTVEFDYSHIGPGDSGYGFVEDRESLDYKIPVEVESFKDRARFGFAKNDTYWRRARLRPYVQLVSS
ncbi:MAG: hypothetical protein QW666_02830 [Candidatus Woesearchaeota archaeon]